MGSDQLLQHLLNTLSSDNTLRSESEKYLREELDQTPASLLDLFDIVADHTIPNQIRLVAATLAKNKIRTSWIVAESDNAYLQAQSIPGTVKDQIKQKLIDTLLKVSPFDSPTVFKQLRNCVQVILRLESSWDESLYQTSQALLDPSSADKLYAGLALVYEISKKHCFDDDRTLLDSIVRSQFPIYEQLLTNIPQAATDERTAAIFYQILKVYKFCTYRQLPQFFTEDLTRLRKWVGYMLQLIKLDGGEMLHKSQKWSFANLHRLQRWHARNNGNLDDQSISTLNSQFIPHILTEFLSLAGRTLPPVCSAYLISFLTDSLKSDSIFESYIKGNLKAILQQFIVPLMATTDAKIETYNDDPVEYIRRYLDVSYFISDFKSTDVATVTFIKMLVRRFEVVAQDLFQTIQDTFSDKSNPRLHEAGLRMLDTSWEQMAQFNPEMDQAFRFFILPQLRAGKWLAAIACQVIADIDHKFIDMPLLEEVTGSVNKLIDNNPDDVALQLESINALDTLCNIDAVSQTTSPRVTHIVELLLQLNQDYELDLVPQIMDDFVLKFSKELEPFALQLATQINQQFMEGAQEFVQNAGEGEDFDKENQLSMLLSTVVSMLLSMTSQKATTQSMLTAIRPSIDLILDNAIEVFLMPALELVETGNRILKQMTPQTWELYNTVLDSFENYGYEYFDLYEEYILTVITYGFNGVSVDSDPHLQRLLTLLLKFYETALEDEEMIQFVLDLLTYIVLNCNNYDSLMDPLLKPIFQSLSSSNMDIKRNYLRLFLSVIVKRPDLVGPLVDNNPKHIGQFVQFWLANSQEKLTTVLDIKLQILAIISLLDANTPGIDQQQLLVKLLDLLQALPAAIDKRVQLLKWEKEGTLDDVVYGEEEVEIDEYEYAELTVETPLDSVNIIQETNKFFANHSNLLPPEKQQALQSLIK